MEEECFNCGNNYNQDLAECPFCQSSPKKAIKSIYLKNNKVEKLENNEEDAFEILAEKFIIKHPCYYNESKILFCYNEKENVWMKSDERDLINIAKNVLNAQGLNQTKIRTSFLNAILDKARWKKPKEVPKNWIQFNNYFYDIVEKKYIPVSKEYFSQVKIPHDIIKNPQTYLQKDDGTNILDTPNIDKLILEWVGEEQFEIFCQLCAYCMYSDYPFARFFIFYGTGQDGKSKAGEFISKLVGIKNTCSIDIDSLNSNRFESQKLYQKTLAICGEVDYKLLKNTRKLKGITGDDFITVEFKNKDPFTYKNFAKLIWYANGLPPTYDKTIGFYRRTITIKFPNKFSEKIGIFDKILSHEYSAFVTKLIPILNNLLTNCFAEKSINEKKEEYENLSNPLKLFIEQCLEVSDCDEDFVPASVLFNEYAVFANSNSFRMFDYSNFISLISSELEENFKLKKLYKLEDGTLYLSTNQFNSLVEKYTRTNNKILTGYKLKKTVVPPSHVSHQFSLKTPLCRNLSKNARDTRDKGTRLEFLKKTLKMNPLDNEELIYKYFDKEYIQELKTSGILVQNRVGCFRLV